MLKELMDFLYVGDKRFINYIDDVLQKEIMKLKTTHIYDYISEIKVSKKK